MEGEEDGGVRMGWRSRVDGKFHGWLQQGEAWARRGVVFNLLAGEGGVKMGSLFMGEEVSDVLLGGDGESIVKKEGAWVKWVLDCRVYSLDFVKEEGAWEGHFRAI